MEKKYQVFISSTYEDLIVERQEVVTAVLNAGHIPAGMELFKAGPTQEEVIREWIEESDIYVLILGPRYGSLNSEGISYTQWEYNLAKELDKPMFSIVLTDDYITEMVSDGKINPIRLETSNDKYIEFKNQVLSSLVVMVDHIAQIRGGVSDSIRYIEKHSSEKLNGWIKGEYYQELEELRIKNEELSVKLVSRQDEVIDMQKELSVTKDNFIGEFSFSYVKDRLTNKKIQSDILNEKLQELEEKKSSGDLSNEEQKIYEKLSEFKDDNFSALDYILKNKDELLTDGLILYTTIVGNILNSEIISVWNQLALIDKVRIKPEVGSFFVDMYDKVTLNENGKKFISMIEIEQSNNAKA
ncbi:DUF4062 domain-containing protein [Enterococcus mundtii]|uniref:DUF4062 domain-containing protein n=1 Tax=Enterococcus mundtii TaxID=53346 RepID=UPI0003313CEC|nr:DUF4062 domain-containing protein [Enterococcus mundtii]EOH58854.1 hypothetical protein UAC_02993 [Enterococcus mundtii ATCC 882]EOU13643.1 hypothetical protein I587_02197 [Enterococcus mundtii ATCC 882]